MTLVDSPAGRYERDSARTVVSSLLHASELDSYKTFNVLHSDKCFPTSEVRVRAFRLWRKELGLKASWMAEHSPSKCERLFGTSNIDKAYELYLESKAEAVKKSHVESGQLRLGDIV